MLAPTPRPAELFFSGDAVRPSPLKFLAIGNLLASAPYSIPRPDLLQLFLHFQARIVTDRSRMPSGIHLPSEGQRVREGGDAVDKGRYGTWFRILETAPPPF